MFRFERSSVNPSKDDTKLWLFSIIINIVLLVGIISMTGKACEPPNVIPPETDSTSTDTCNLSYYSPALLDALIMVESSDRDSAYNSHEDAVGCLQVRPIMLKEINRILAIQGKKIQYALQDRWSRHKSIEMFHIWRTFHHSEDTQEHIARCWNGGPKGYKRSVTEGYWKKVQEHLK